MKRLVMRIALPTLAAASFGVFGACGGSKTPETTTPSSPDDSDALGDPAQDSSAEAPDALAQADRGAEVYDANCSFCHGDEGEGAGENPQVVGGDVLDGYADAGELLDYVKAEMPADDPGGLSAEEFQDVVAFMLRENGVELSNQSVTPSAASDIAF